MDPITVYSDVYRILTGTPGIATWDDAGILHVEPLTHEEATIFARTLTVHIVTTYQGRATA